MLKRHKRTYNRFYFHRMPKFFLRKTCKRGDGCCNFAPKLAWFAPGGIKDTSQWIKNLVKYRLSARERLRF